MAASPSLMETPPDQRNELFLNKLKLCERLLDFSSPTEHYDLKETKRQQLIDLAEYVSTNKGAFNDSTYQPFIHMISANIFRPLPSHNSKEAFFATEPDESFQEPAWPHLHLIYELLRKFVVSNDTDSQNARACLTVPFVTGLVDLFNSEDAREREYLKTILHRIYGKVMPLRLPIRQAVISAFHRVVYENQRHSGVSELLEILGSIINGFGVPLKQEHHDILRKGLLPLHLPAAMASYQKELSFCVTQFVEKEPALANEVVSCLLKHWPGRSTKKEVMFLEEIEEVLELTRPEDLREIVLVVFKKVCKCAQSWHFQVAERALFYWNNEFVINLMMMYRKELMPVVVACLQNNLATHWNENVLSLTCNVQLLLQGMDSALYDRCRKLYQMQRKEEAKKQEERARRWQMVYSMAQKRGSLKDVNRVQEDSSETVDTVGIGNGWSHGHVEQNKIDGNGVSRLIEGNRQAKV